MKHLIIILFLCLAGGLFGQSLELIGGLSSNSFFHTSQGLGSLQTNYTSGQGYALAVGADFDLKGLVEKPLPLKVRLGIHSYTARFNMSDGGRSYSRSTDAGIDQTSVDIGFYPLNLLLIQNLSLSVGAEFNILLKDNSLASGSAWRQCVCPSGIEKSSGPKEISKGNTARLSSILSYEIKILDDISFVPQYQFSVGLSSEFVNIETNTKTLRHAFLLGLRKDLQ